MHLKVPGTQATPVVLEKEVPVADQSPVRALKRNVAKICFSYIAAEGGCTRNRAPNVAANAARANAPVLSQSRCDAG